MNSLQMEIDLQRLRTEQALILNQVDNAIALFDSGDRLILFNQKLAHMWGLTLHHLEDQPHCYEVLAAVVNQGNLTQTQSQELWSALEQAGTTSVTYNISQNDHTYLEVRITATPEGGRLLVLGDAMRLQPTQVQERQRFKAALSQAHTELEQCADQLTIAYQELQNTLEKLQVAQEELPQQNEELTSDRLYIEEQRRQHDQYLFNTECKQTEEALRASETLYRQIIETAQEGVWIIDAQSKTTLVNRTMAEMLGYTVAEMIGMSMFEFMDQSEQAIAAANVERRRQGIIEKHDFKFRRQDGTDLWAIVSTNPLLDESGQYIGALGMVTDITERKQAEEMLQKVNEELEIRVEQRTTQFKNANAQLKQEIAERQRVEAAILKSQTRLKLLNNVSALIISGASVDQLIQTTLKLISEKFPTLRVLYATIDEQGTLTIRYSEQPLSMPCAVGIVSDLTVVPEYLSALQINQPVIVEDVRTDRRLVALASKMLASGCQAILDVPLWHSEKLVGLLSFDAPTPYSWSDYEIATLTEIAEYISLAIKKAYAERERRAAEALLQRQNLKSQLFADVTLKIRQSLQLEEILQTTVMEVRQLLASDRALIMRVYPDGFSCLVTEAAEPNMPSLVGLGVTDDCLGAEHLQKYRQGKISTITDVENADIAPCLIEFLQQFNIKAKLVVPIFLKEELWGLLIVHECKHPRQWSGFEIELLQQLANQVSVAIAQSQFLEALRESEERFRTMADSAPVLLWVSGVDRLCNFFNQGWLNFTGRTLEQEIGNGWSESVHPEDSSHYLDTYKTAFDNRQTFHMEYRLRRADGEYRWILDTGTPRFMSDGSFAGYIGSCVDITDRKQAEEEIRKALETEKELSELKSRFVSMASHEFRTPLSTILLYTELLEHYSHQWDESQKRSYLQQIQTAVKNMIQMLNDVLIIGKAAVGKLEFKPTWLDLGALCRELVSESQLADREGNIIVFSSSKDCNMAYLDGKLLRLIFTNLLSNALKYSPPGSTVHFSYNCRNETAVFQVQDEGIGIPQEDEQHLFETFHRATNVGNIPGTGLGLAIVKQCVDLYQGTITVQSIVGQGTTFTVMLPMNTQH